MRNSFVFYSSWWEAIKNLPREIQGEVLTAIIEYGLTGETTESLKPITKALLALVMPQIDSNNKKYENGSKGGRPATKPKPSQNQTETKPKPNGNQTGTYNVLCNMNNQKYLGQKVKGGRTILPHPSRNATASPATSTACAAKCKPSASPSVSRTKSCASATSGR